MKVLDVLLRVYVSVQELSTTSASKNTRVRHPDGFVPKYVEHAAQTPDAVNQVKQQ